jgi:hypothetical protein
VKNRLTESREVLNVKKVCIGLGFERIIEASEIKNPAPNIKEL